MEEAKEWDRCHGIIEKDNNNNATIIPKNLFTDNDPATTIKGNGFKNASVATKTIELATQPGCKYKSYWTIRAMKERAVHHPHQTHAMKEAIFIFDVWLKKRSNEQKDKIMELEKEYIVERQQRDLLIKSFANNHARRYCKSLSQFLKLEKEDKADALKTIRNAGEIFYKTKDSDVSFNFLATSFVYMFGAPGIHNYGSHICEEANKVNLPAYRCLCRYKGKHVVKVINNAKEKLKLGKRFPLTNFNLIYDGEKQSGIILSGSGCDNNSVKQRSIKSYFSRMIGKNKKRKKSTTYKQQEEV